jgi:hypothetical protein
VDNVLQAARADAVHAILVFLDDLLERHPDRLAKRRLAHVQNESTHANAAADVFFDGPAGF